MDDKLPPPLLRGLSDTVERFFDRNNVTQLTLTRESEHGPRQWSAVIGNGHYFANTPFGCVEKSIKQEDN